MFVTAESKKPPDVPTEAELKKYCEAVWQTKNMQDMLIIKTLLYTGIRVSELIRLAIEDIDFDRCQIRITAGKGKKRPNSSVSEKFSQSISNACHK